ncbi:MAG: peptidoglycan DD-metalloendopeptidase family protein [Bacteroidota bacterium]
MNTKDSVARSKRRSKQQTEKRLILTLSAFALLVLVSYLSFGQDKAHLKASADTHLDINQLGYFPIQQPTLRYGMAMDTFQVSEGIIKNNEFLSDILLRYHIAYKDIDELAMATRKAYDVRKLRVGKPYTILSKDTSQAAQYFVYEPDIYSYVIFDLNQKTAEIVERPIETKIEAGSGTVLTSLWQTMTENGLSYELTAKMEDVFAWSIDFHHVQKGDQFKFIYEQKYINDKKAGVGEILAAYYKNYDNEYYAIHFENDRHSGFYDLEARPMKKAFLKAPVKYSRISSRYNLRRFHPVLKRTRPHYGTDYAAPYGTPIYAVADGVVVAAGRRGGNGNFVKIRHDKVYQTQYLHMQGFAKGIRSGVHVKQGQVIGYVGSTGLATGPHVCFRFWKNGRQVNHMRENLPPPEPMPEDDIPAFNQIRDTLKAKLDEIPFKDNSEEMAIQPMTLDSLISNP